MTDTTAPTVLTTGASRGLGLEFCRQWLARGARVLALARDPKGSAGLQALAREHGARLVPVPCDVADDTSVDAAAAAVAAATDHLDVAVQNAGTYGRHGGTLAELDMDEVRRVLEVNALGPLRVARALLPLLERGRQPRLAAITSLMGSIGDNSSGGSWAYRMSKAALNMAWRNLAHELAPRGITCAVLHPGWVRTGMGGPGAPLTPEESVAGMLRVLDALGPEDSGAFLAWDGRRLPW